jgi:HSP20 family protein
VDSIIVKADLPGLESKVVDVSLLGDLLTIKGEKKKEEEKKEVRFHSIERFHGTFQRSFRIPAAVLTDKIEASFEKGVLKVVLPKTEEAKAKPIKVQVK